MSTTQLKCTSKELFEWLDKHLDDCPCDWHTLDDSPEGVTGLAIAFNIEEEI